jgi:peptidyl-tRNA hydrolase
MQKSKVCVLGLLVGLMACEVSHAASFNFNGGGSKKKEEAKQVVREVKKEAPKQIELTQQEREELNQSYSRQAQAAEPVSSFSDTGSRQQEAPKQAVRQAQKKEGKKGEQAKRGREELLQSSGEGVPAAPSQATNPNNDIVRNPNVGIARNPNSDIPRTPVVTAPKNPNTAIMASIPKNPNAASSVPRNPNNANAIPRNPNVRQ